MYLQSGVHCAKRSFGTSLLCRSAFSLSMRYFRANEHMKSCFRKIFWRKTAKQQQGFRNGGRFARACYLFVRKEIHTRFMHRVASATNL